MSLDLHSHDISADPLDLVEACLESAGWRHTGPFQITTEEGHLLDLTLGTPALLGVKPTTTNNRWCQVLASGFGDKIYPSLIQRLGKLTSYPSYTCD